MRSFCLIPQSRMRHFFLGAQGPAQPRSKKAMTVHYTLRCRECQRDWGNHPSSICMDCLAPLEVQYDYDAARGSFHASSVRNQRPAKLGAGSSSIVTS